MKIFLGADHGGYELKNIIREHLSHKGYEVVDEGALTHDPDDDDVEFAFKVAVQMIGENDPCFGVLVCRSGQEMAMAANRMRGIRAALAWSEEIARASREHNDANVLTLPADYIDQETAIKIVDAFLDEKFAEKERYQRRIKMLDELS